MSDEAKAEVLWLDRTSRDVGPGCKGVLGVKPHLCIPADEAREFLARMSLMIAVGVQTFTTEQKESKKEVIDWAEALLATLPERRSDV